MKHLFIAMLASLSLATPLMAEGDAEAGKKVFGKCKSCHMIADPEGNVLAKGGRTGPNLYGIVGRVSGTGGFRYSKALISAGENGLVWDEAQIASFATDPRGFLKALGGDSKTKMTFKLRKGGEDVAAYLASFSPAPVEDAESVDEDEAAATEEEAMTTEGAEAETVSE